MDSDLYKRAAELFQETCELPEEQRSTHLDRTCGKETELRREVETLLRFHQPAPTGSGPLPQVERTPAPMTRGGTRGRRRRRFGTPALILGVALAAGAGLLAFRAWTLGAVEEALSHRQVDRLNASLHLRVARLREWAETQRAQARDLAGDPGFARVVEELARIPAASNNVREDILGSPAYRSALAHMRRAPESLGGMGPVLVSPEGVLLIMDNDALVGARVSVAGAGLFRRALLGEWVVARPYRDRVYVDTNIPGSIHPLMAVAGPVRNESGRIVAVSAWRFLAAPALEPLFQFANTPGFPEVFAFDDKSYLLTEPRDTETLRSIGLFSGPPGTGAALRARLRDPGGDLSGGFQPEIPSERWPMTRMCQLAIEGGSGTDSTGYRNLRGRKVVGAWTWLADLEMGVAAEMELEETIAPARPIGATFHWLLGILGGATVVALLSSSWFGIFRRRRGDRAFGAYVLDRQLGKGGMAEVFLARHALLKRPTAVKILDGNLVDAKSVRRFEREASLASSLTHPNTIQIFDYGRTPDGQFYYAMEYVDGLNLAQLVALGGPLPPARAIHLLRQICGSLEEAHAAGFVHRDIKPANLMVCRRGGEDDVIKVLDFGIAREVLGANVEATGLHQVAGTPLYIAPERLQSPQSRDPRSDIYSLGAVAFHLVTGRNVFEGPGPAEILYQVLSAERPSPSRLRGTPLPPGLEKLILGCLAVDPSDRPSTIREVAETLSMIETQEGWGEGDARAWWESQRVRLAWFKTTLSQ